MVIRGKGKSEFLDGTIPKPKIEDPNYQNWEIQNSMVMAWLIHSMDKSIGDCYLFYSTTQEIWDAMALAYSDLKDSSQVYEFRNRIRDSKQGDTTVTQFFNTLKKLWQKVDLFNQVEWKDTEDATLYRKMMARE